MPSPREYYKSIHPDYFSDSVIEEVSQLDRTLLEFHLSTLTGRSQEADFERFARRLCEREICPNLLPTTGPTGGGDSKADAETFPVADSLALKWYRGIGSEASRERWAFAFSAKAVWLPKLKSDIQKIVETGRGYQKAFFVSNQSVPAKKRAKAEDDLRQKHGIDVRILDRTWILERVFAGRHEDLATSELKVTTFTRQRKRTGPTDAARIGDLAELEKRIDSATADGRPGPEMVDDALEAADVCRSLERPRAEIEGRYARAGRLADAYGTRRQQVEAAYQWGWTLFWWLEDIPATVTQYGTVEARAQGSDNVFDLERLSNLLTVLRTHARRGGNASLADWVKDKEPALRAELERLAGEEGRPSVSLRAKTLLLQDEVQTAILTGADPTRAFEELRAVVDKCDGLVGFSVEQLVRVLTVIGNAVTDNAAFDALFERVVEVSSKRQGEVRAALMLLERGRQLMDHERWTKAITVVGQALGRLYKHETRREIVFALFLCAEAYERIGLLWAARGTYLAGAGIAANEFWTYGTVSRGFAGCINSMKWIELRLGRLPQLLAWHELDLWAQERLGSAPFASEARESAFDLLVSRLLLRVPYEQLEQLDTLPDSLDRLGLDLAASALLFALGHPERIAEYTGPEGAPALDPSAVWGLIVDVPLPEQPELYASGMVRLSSRILGCRVSISCSLEDPCVEVAESVLAALESFMSTGAIAGAFAFEPELTAEVVCDPAAVDFIRISELERLGRPHLVIACRPASPHDLSPEDAAAAREAIFKCALTAFAHTVRLRDIDADLRSLFEEERVGERASAFAGSIGPVRNVLGAAPKFRLRDWIDPEAASYAVLRQEPWLPSQPVPGGGEAEKDRVPARPATGDPPPDLIDFERIGHDQMEVVSLIRVRLWDRAGWAGAFYLIDKDNSQPPVLGLMFKERSAASEIFADWQAELGLIDEGRRLRISIVRGIDRRNPSAYRVVVGSSFDDVPGPGQLMTMMQRINRMDATDPANLERFLTAYRVHGRFLLVPAYLIDGVPSPDFDLAIGMLELHVREAWEIGRNDPDGSGIDVDEDVIIPEGVMDPPVRELLEWKRRHSENDDK